MSDTLAHNTASEADGDASVISPDLAVSRDRGLVRDQAQPAIRTLTRDKGEVPPELRRRRHAPRIQSGVPGEKDDVSWWRWTHGMVKRTAIFCDMLAVSATGIFAWLILPLLPNHDGTDYGVVPSAIQASAMIGCASLFFLRVEKAIDAYRIERLHHFGRSLADLLLGFAPTAIVMWGFAWAFLPDLLERSDWFVLWAACGFAVLFLSRAGIATLCNHLIKGGYLRRRVVIFGATPCAERMLTRLQMPCQADEFEIVGLFDERGEDRRPQSLAGVPVLGDIDDLQRIVGKQRIDIIVIALPWSAAVRIHGLLGRVQTVATDVLVPLTEDEFMLRFAQVRDISGVPTLMVMRQPLRGTQLLMKRMEDLVVATAALAVVWPILLVSAIAIRLESPGPVIFRQTRVGFNNRSFTMWKLRTMTVDDRDDGAIGTLRHDPRITRVGAVLRRLSLDELPQLFNVLAGNMSIVGPRAHVPNMLVSDQRYVDAVRDYAARWRVKPGITGWAQINGMRGGIHSLSKARAGVELDIHYIENWSLWLDLKIMFRTLTKGMSGRDIF